MSFHLCVGETVPFSPGGCLQICPLLEHNILEDARPVPLAAGELGANGKLGTGWDSSYHSLWVQSHLPLSFSFYICKMKIIIAMTSKVYGVFCDYSRQIEPVPDFKCHLCAGDSDFHKLQTQISSFLLNTPNRHLQPPCPKLSSLFPHSHSYSSPPFSTSPFLPAERARSLGAVLPPLPLSLHYICWRDSDSILSPLDSFIYLLASSATLALHSVPSPAAQKSQLFWA